MALDPQARALLEQLALAGGPPFESLPVEQAREGVMGMRELAGPPPTVARVEELTVPASAGPIPARAYVPDSGGPLPVILYFHGGCFVMGNVDFLDTPCRALANSAQAIVVSVEYRLAPEHPFPAAPEDCYEATCWVATHAAQLGGDQQRVAVAGDSAGGNLAAVVALMARDRGTPPLVHQLLVYPITNYSFDTASYRECGDGYLLTKALMEWGWTNYIRSSDDVDSPYASPLRADDLGGLPPATVITAEFDPLRDEGQTYAQRLQEAGVSTSLKHYEGMIHAFWQLGGVLDQGRRVIEDTGAVLRTAFQVQGTPLG
jgi:acetyl esterase